MVGCSNFFNKDKDKEIKPQGKMYFNFFDTVSNIYSYAGDSEEEFNENSAYAASILEEYHKLFDIYHEYTDVVNLCTINKNAGGKPQKVDDKLIDFLLYAKELYDLTNGKMNIMLGALLKPWHDARTIASASPKDAKLPDKAVLEEAKKHTSISSLVIDKENKTVYILDKDASLDVGAIGKGYATEMAGKALEAKGCTSYVLNIGGNIKIIGTKKSGDGWITGIKDPLNSDYGYAMYLKLADISCVTSGNYERYFTIDGVKYHHIIDPDTLYPANYFVSITIITKNSGLADALSTALFCMSYEDGIKIIENIKNNIEDDIDVVWIYEDGSKVTTPGVKEVKN